MTKITISCLLVVTAVSISSGMQVSKDSVDFTDTSDYFFLKNSANAPATIDSITIKFTGNHLRFTGSQFMIDTGIVRRHLTYGDISCPMRPKSDSELEVYNIQNKMTVKSKDSLRINTISLGSCYGCLGKRLAAAAFQSKDTVVLIFKDSNKSSGSITAIVPLLYGSHVVSDKAPLTKGPIRNLSGKTAVLLNGRQIPKNSKTTKNMKWIQAINK